MQPLKALNEQLHLVVFKGIALSSTIYTWIVLGKCSVAISFNETTN